MTTEIDWEAAANYWIAREPEEVRVPADELLAMIEEFIGSHKVCALATAGNGIVRNTPVEYLYDSGTFWLFCEGGLKFKALKASPDVSLAIFNDDPSFNKVAGLQVTGTARVVEFYGADYTHACELRHLNIEKLQKMQVTLHVIKIVPTRYDYVDATLNERGFSPRQHWER